MIHRPFRCAAAAALAIVGLARAGAQEHAFRGRADLVPIYATVTDAEDRLIADLGRGDFEVYDNGRKQAVTTFSNDVQPFSAVVMLDRSSSMLNHFDTVRDAGIAFVKSLMPGDRLRIGSLGDRVIINPPEFTSDRELLIHLLQTGLQPIGYSSPVWMAIDHSITALLPERGRRVVFVFSDGHDVRGAGMGITNLGDVVRRVRVDDIMVYAVGFGSEGGGVSARGQPPDPGLRLLAQESGGGYFEWSEAQDLSTTFARVSDELHHQYLLGFTPARLDGKIHRVEVRVKRPQVRVRARQTYQAATE